ncbi:EF-hand domain-containing protein [Anaerocolumna sp. AGMB13020]|uniref:EF-hand domain-containing protein n=1 Tax=Anaerocolumna sp. AGMB13020 TaxID=3081750 RepID=UPI002952E186|nr:EF-hand domain-containing protein [Anaerocolumna sp. AGMB13020]WOO37504.1 EF-hand domain-containing protein [Anaerocolumna sp. AGMB13020]
MIHSISSNSVNWYQQTKNYQNGTTKAVTNVSTDTLTEEEEKAARSNLSLIDVMGLMQKTGSVKEAETKEDVKDDNSSTLDLDGDGTLSSDEYENLVDQLGLKNALSSEDFFARYDTDEDGEITAEELRAVNAEKRMPPPPPPVLEEEESEEGFSSAVDTDGDGYISTEEYEAFVSGLNTEEPLSSEEFFTQYDTDKDGKISAEEVRSGIEKAQVTPPEPPVRGLSSEIDLDGDGSLSADEYENLVSLLGTENTLSSEEFFTKYDTDGDGEISAEEIKTAMEAAGQRQQVAKAYENSYRYTEDERSTGLDSIA